MSRTLARIGFATGFIFLLLGSLQLVACDERQSQESDAMEGHEGGDAGPGTPVDPSREQDTGQKQGGKGGSDKTVHSPGMPMTKEELERLKREAERPDQPSQEPTDKDD
jgi:hypothetical protein